MKRKYKVGPGINCNIAGTRCVGGQVVELDPNNHVVDTHVAQGDLVEVADIKPSKKGE